MLITTDARAPVFLVALRLPGDTVAGAEIGRQLAGAGVEARETRRTAPHDVAQMRAGDRARRIGKGIGRGVDGEQQRPRPARTILERAVDRPTVEENRRAGPADSAVDHVLPQPAELFIADPDHEIPGPVVHAVKRAVVAAADEGQRALLQDAAIEVDADRYRAVIGVRPGRDVLVPFEAAGALL